MAGNTARNYGGAGGNMVPRSTKLTEALANAAPQAGTNRSGGGSGYSYNMNGTPMGPQEVQDVVAQNAQNAVNAAAGTNAAQAAALQMEPGLQVNGMGQNGTGNWYSLLGAGGKVDPNNAALFLAMNPGAYNSPYTPAMQTLMNQLLNPEQFRYDVNADGLYQQIKDNYMKAGKQAMMDTQGQSAALTGGYGNSYGAMAGQQAYQESLGGLAGMIPELQQLAYQQYLNGEDAKRNNLEALNKLNEQEYARWMDDMAAYVQALGNLQLPMGNSGGGGGDPGVVGGPMNPFGKFLMSADLGGGQGGYQIDPAKLAQLQDGITSGYINADMVRAGMADPYFMKGYKQKDWEAVANLNGITRQPPAYDKGNRGPNYDALPNQTNGEKKKYDSKSNLSDMGY